MRFPFRWPADELLPEDFERHDLLFAHAIRSHFPCDTVSFERTDQPAPAAAPELAAAAARNEPVPDAAGSRLFLPFANEKGPFAVAVLADGRPELYAMLRSRKRLLGQHRQLVRELRQLKQSCADPVTGLLNGCHLRQSLTLRLQQASAPDGLPLHLLLIEIYPWARNAGQGLRFIGKIASQLDSFLGEVAPLHHLGSGVFAQVIEADEEQVLAMGNGVLRWLQRENLARGHIGISVREEGKATAVEARVGNLFDQAWQALHVARRRAPHALCTHAHLDPRREHPLRRPPPAMRRELGNRWRGVDRFALLLLHQDQAPGGANFSARVRTVAGPETVLLPLSAREAFVVLPGAGREEAEGWIDRFRRRLPPPVSYSMGVALFPCADFKKAEMVLNARKALLHTRFLGPGSATVFDAVSLNISGDYYYEEGDLARAVKEYRRGLLLDGASVNLLNSLGVAYAQMNRYRQAIPLFEQALAGDPENFMALFNLGYGHLHFRETARAVEYFERALARDEDHFDLLLQLGKLYCERGRYQEAAALLVRAEGLDAGDRNGVGRGRVHSCLGQAHKGLGQHQEAIVHLQRAVQCNPRDAGALGLLGELYALEGQGCEIALSLCRQAVELDDSRGEHWCRLGLVQWLAGEVEEAEAAVRRCLRLDRTNVDALRLLGEICRRRGRNARARKVWERLLRHRPGDEEARQALQRLGKEPPA